MTCGIYAIVHRSTGQRYIGSSSEIELRWQRHRWALLRGDHDNCHLQRAWNRDGEAAFRFEVIELVPADQLSEREQYLLAHYASDELYNIAPEVCRPPSRRGVTLSPQHREKIGAAQKGRRLPPEHCAKIAAAHRGKPKAENARAALSAARTGKPLSASQRASISASHTGKPLSEAHRLAISEGQRRRHARRRGEQ